MNNLAIAITLEQHRFFSLHLSKRGRQNIIFTADNKKHIHAALKQLGYGCAKLDEKNIFFLREGIRITPITFFQLRRAFGRFLMTLDLSSREVNKSEIINEYHHQQPIRNSQLLKTVLFDSLTQKEQQQIRKELKKVNGHLSMPDSFDNVYTLAIAQ
jgi:hypothetical protein